MGAHSIFTVCPQAWRQKGLEKTAEACDDGKGAYTCQYADAITEPDQITSERRHDTIAAQDRQEAVFRHAIRTRLEDCGLGAREGSSGA